MEYKIALIKYSKIEKEGHAPRVSRYVQYLSVEDKELVVTDCFQFEIHNMGDKTLFLQEGTPIVPGTYYSPNIKSEYNFAQNIPIKWDDTVEKTNIISDASSNLTPK